MGISEENRKIAVYLRSKLGGSPKVERFSDDQQFSTVDIMTVEDCPDVGISTFGTIGMSDTSINITAHGRPLRVEILMSLASSCQHGANITASSAFNVINSGIIPTPDTVIPSVINIYEQCAMKHIMLIDPFLWKIEAQSFVSKTVTWLQAIPISEAERNFASTEGGESLQDLFEKHQIDVFNLSRPSIL